jgi:hypothetical protein
MMTFDDRTRATASVQQLASTDIVRCLNDEGPDLVCSLCKFGRCACNCPPCSLNEGSRHHGQCSCTKGGHKCDSWASSMARPFCRQCSAEHCFCACKSCRPNDQPSSGRGQIRDREAPEQTATRNHIPAYRDQLPHRQKLNAIVSAGRLSSMGNPVVIDSLRVLTSFMAIYAPQDNVLEIVRVAGTRSAASQGFPQRGAVFASTERTVCLSAAEVPIPSPDLIAENTPQYTVTATA